MSKPDATDADRVVLRTSKQNTYRAANFCFYCKRGPQDHIGREMECPSDETNPLLTPLPLPESEALRETIGPETPACAVLQAAEELLEVLPVPNDFYGDEAQALREALDAHTQ